MSSIWSIGLPGKDPCRNDLWHGKVYSHQRCFMVTAMIHITHRVCYCISTCTTIVSRVCQIEVVASSIELTTFLCELGCGNYVVHTAPLRVPSIVYTHKCNNTCGQFSTKRDNGILARSVRSWQYILMPHQDSTQNDITYLRSTSNQIFLCRR